MGWIQRRCGGSECDSEEHVGRAGQGEEGGVRGPYSRDESEAYYGGGVM